MILPSKLDILKPCPFCGSDVKIIIEDHPNCPERILTYITCEKCHAKTEDSLTGKDENGKYVTLTDAVGSVINKWNKRTSINYLSSNVSDMGKGAAL